ncbi:phosphatase and actin regulator 2 [Trichonephila clavipes]|nr:phosphatase and actin regulator 2 [Trichonephila clavipes]
MYKNALKEDFIRVVEDLDGTVESTNTIAKLKTKIEKSSTFEKKQKIELAKLQLAQLEKEDELQTAKNKTLSLNPAAKVEEKQFETLNKETATHISIREAEDWFRPIDLAKECDIYISSRSGSLLCKKVNGAMKTSSVNFNTPSPMESKHRRFVLLRRIFEPWKWKRRKKRNRFEQTSRTLERKISMRSTKDQLVKKDILMPVKHNVFLWNLPDVEEVPSHDGETVLFSRIMIC